MSPFFLIRAIFSSRFQCLLPEATLHSSIALPAPHGSPYGIKFVCGLQPESLPCILPVFLNEKVMEPHGSLWQPAMFWWEHKGQGGTLNILDHNWEMLSTEMLEKVVVMFVFGCLTFILSGATNYSLTGFLMEWWGQQMKRWPVGDTCCHLLQNKMCHRWLDGRSLIYLFFCLFVILSRSQIVNDSVFVSKNQAHVRNSHRISWTPVWVCCHWSITGRTTWDIFFIFGWL